MVHLQRQIEKLKRMIAELGALAERRVCDAITAVHERDVVKAQAVIDGDREIDLMEVEVEEECLHALALHQPVAFDLRYIISVLKINVQLERVGDLAVNVAEQAVFLAGEERVEHVPFDLGGMCERVQEMLRRSLKALIDIDPAEAEAVRKLDDAVDRIHRDMYDQIEDAIRNNTGELEQMIHFLNVSRHLERIADHATNIAKDVVYMSSGEIVRHRRARRMRDAARAAAENA